MNPRPDVIVVGAGFAGVAAASALAERGVRVTVLETRQRVGGRAASWTDPRSGEVLDNGQHVLGSFYDATLQLLDRLGTRDALDADPSLRIRFWERGHGEYELAAPNLPAPFHWLAAVGGCSRLSAMGRMAALTLHPKVKALLAQPRASADLTVERWLVGAGGVVTEDLAALLRPLAIAALNEDTKDGSALLFANAIDRLLSASAPASGLALARRGLGELFTGFERFMESRGGSVRFRTTALGVRIEGGRTVGVSLLGGEKLDAGAVVLAVPHERFGWMLRPEYLEPYRDLAGTPWSPIVSTVHTFDRPILPSRFVGLIGTKTQWAFDRGARGDERYQVGTIRSAAFHDCEREAGSIAAETTAELREAFPAARDARVLAARVFKERRGTLRSTPMVQPMRPGAATAIGGLFLAGDWTDTGLPATIESAVLSGHRAATLAA
ncbi:MAG TPA: hydroxysqualene dehydroxylase HpnE [Candidatus Eisenbacteria bacterium]|nr:hydroxysqualene dehydroxylase HpnE [Candidatus Eisenbacteria bacterium]